MWKSLPARSICGTSCRSTCNGRWRPAAAPSSTARCPRTCRRCAAAGRCTCACCASAATGTARRIATSRCAPTSTRSRRRRCPRSSVRSRARSRRRSGMTLDADLCILNYYDAEGRMGLHQDKDESAASLAAGVPVVSVSIGDTARFLFGGTRRRDPNRSAAARIGRRVRLRRPGAPALSRRVAHPARHGAARARSHRALQPDVPAVLSPTRRLCERALTCECRLW